MPLSKFTRGKVVESTPKPAESPAPAPDKRKRADLHIKLELDEMDRIKRLALDERCNLTELVRRGIGEILAKRGLPPL